MMQAMCAFKCSIAISLILATILTTLLWFVIPKPRRDVTIMTWNILAPMWIDRQAMNSRGLIDMNLLDDEVRLLMIMERIRTQKPDIVHLQEVQENTFEEIKNELSDVYSPVAFVPHTNDYWKNYLTGNHNYTKNGVATFYKKEKFDLISSHPFTTSHDGNVALFAVIGYKKGFRINTTITLVNCHLETGVKTEEALTRIAQGTAIASEIEKETSRKDSVVVIAGDLNTQSPYPGYLNFKSKGFSDAVEELSKTALPTHYYEFPVPISENETTDWVSIDHVFLRSTDQHEDRVRLESVEVPTVDSNETSIKFYAEKLTEILKRNLGNSRRLQSLRILNSKSYESIQATVRDGTANENKANKVLRLGSDHLPVTVKLQVR